MCFYFNHLWGDALRRVFLCSFLFIVSLLTSFSVVSASVSSSEGIKILFPTEIRSKTLDSYQYSLDEGLGLFLSLNFEEFYNVSLVIEYDFARSGFGSNSYKFGENESIKYSNVDIEARIPLKPIKDSSHFFLIPSVGVRFSTLDIDKLISDLSFLKKVNNLFIGLAAGYELDVGGQSKVKAELGNKYVFLDVIGQDYRLMETFISVDIEF